MLKIEEYSTKYINDAIEIWNDIVEDGIAFPQKDALDPQTGDAVFNSQSFTGIAIDADSGEVVGLYILHPNNVGRCGHISNASYAVKKNKRGQHIGQDIAVQRGCRDKYVCTEVVQKARLYAARRDSQGLFAQGRELRGHHPALYRTLKGLRASNLVIGNKYKKHAQKTDEDGACAATSTIVVATDHGTRAITVTAES